MIDTTDHTTEHEPADSSILTPEEETDPLELERRETTAYFWKAILLLLLMIIIASIAIKKW